MFVDKDDLLAIAQIMEKADIQFEVLNGICCDDQYVEADIITHKEIRKLADLIEAAEA